MPSMLDTVKIAYSQKHEHVPCPFCDNKSLLLVFFQSDKDPNVYPNHFFIVRRCEHCKRLSFINEFRHLSKKGMPIAINIHKYPSKKITELEQPGIPEKVKADYAEGLKDLANGCYKSACVMFRRSVQNAVLELGASKGKKLEKQIQQLAKKGIITPELKGLAEEARVMGNKGAHPLKSDFDDLTPEDAREMALFLENFIRYAFIVRKQLQDRLDKKKSAAQQTTAPKT